jgi:hypothetical protein
MGSGGMVYIPSFIKFCSCIQKLIGEDTQTHRQHGDLISILHFFFFQNKDIRLNTVSYGDKKNDVPYLCYYTWAINHTRKTLDLMKSNILWDVKPCSLVDLYWRTDSSSKYKSKPRKDPARKLKLYGPPKNQYTATGLYDVTSQDISIHQFDVRT